MPGPCCWTIKVDLNGETRTVEVPPPHTSFAAFERAVGRAFDLSESDPPGARSQDSDPRYTFRRATSFFYRDCCGRVVRFDSDAGLSRALRACPRPPLRVTAVHHARLARLDAGLFGTCRGHSMYF